MSRTALTLGTEHLGVVLAYDDGEDAGIPEIAAIGNPPQAFEPLVDVGPAPHASLDQAVPLSILPETSRGHLGAPGLIGSRPQRSAWAPRFTLEKVETSATSATIRLRDPIAELAVEIAVEVDDAIILRATVTNEGTTPYQVLRLAPTIPLPPHYGDALTFDGRWCREFSTRRTTLGPTVQIENREGRSSHTKPPGLFVGTPGFGAERGEVLGCQLAWSGNHTIVADRRPDGRAYIQASELLEPGEVELAPGESYSSPPMVIVWSERGLNNASQQFHRHVRGKLGPLGPRPVILNTWEAVYFDHDIEVLKQLADRGARVGVERFVLDDGWFGSRRHDRAGLGDWWVSADVWPDGLHPIVDHVNQLGMDFGLWVEPEMVNPDSDLFRAHPEWALTTEGYEPLLARDQLILDLGRAEVRDYLFEHLHALLDTYNIAYLKWDMNRPATQGSHHGHAGVHGHVVGLYELLDRLRQAHPNLEIESCSSGGGRPDLGILGKTQRIWTSDCNDALERHHIQAGAQLLLPPEVLGAHIGPDVAHTTGRQQSVGFRAATALFGHLGIEWNLLDADENSLEAVAAAIEIYKQHRGLLHSGTVWGTDTVDPSVRIHGVVSQDQSQALWAFVQLVPSAYTTPLPMRILGLDPDRHYRVRIDHSLNSHRTHDKAHALWFDPQPGDLVRSDVTVSGAQLATSGLRLPVLMPESVVLVECTDVDLATKGASA